MLDSIVSVPSSLVKSKVPSPLSRRNPFSSISSSSSEPESESYDSSSYDSSSYDSGSGSGSLSTGSGSLSLIT